MKRFPHIVAGLGLILLASLAVMVTHDAAFSALHLLHGENASADSCPVPCADDSDCEGCICIYHSTAEPPQLEGAYLGYIHCAYLTINLTTVCTSITPETLERPPEHPLA